TSLDDTLDSPDTPTERSTYNTASIERTGAGGINDYTSSDSADVEINDIAPNKYLVATSEASTGGADVTIGEIVRYRLTVVIPEGTSSNFQVLDLLPPGMMFVNDGTAKAIFVSNLGITSSSVGTLPVPGIADADCQLDGNSADGSSPSLPAACAALPDNNIGSTNDTTVNFDNYASGYDVFFKLGTLLNSDSDADPEYVVIEFNALVDNSSGSTSNDAGETLSNDFIVTINGPQNGPASNSVDVHVQEPLLTVSKLAAIDASRDAGDTVTYTLTINAAAGATRTTAFDLALTDVLDVNLTPVSVVRTSTTQAAACAGGAAFSTSESFTGQTMNASATCLDPGGQIVFTITATLKDTTAISTYSLENDADLTYTSLPGTSGTTVNATGSQVTGGAGSDTGERNGSGTAPNDYTST
ncbi:isopeptide-forming domain-containing fimbrial protein, partial [bacterium]|nr:isopeptide-forming domain-containing fimbrial protein [bacterium]